MGAAATALTDYEFPYQAWDAAWKTVLLNQFHDILPGSSIARVHDEAEAQLSNVVNWSKDALRNIGRALARTQGEISVFNSLSWREQNW